MSSNLKNIQIAWLIPELAPQSLGRCDISFSPLTCLSQATSNQRDLILIVFNISQTHCHQEVVELCTILKAHPLTTKTRVAAFIEKPHQKLIWGLSRAGLDFVDICTGMNPEHIEEKVCQLWQTQSFTPVQTVLEKLCPFLEYLQSGDGHDFPVCGAYRNRMVLGGTRLHEICHTMDHLYCEYYLNPKVKS